jgi:hypothetical protein
VVELPPLVPELPADELPDVPPVPVSEPAPEPVLSPAVVPLLPLLSLPAVSPELPPLVPSSDDPLSLGAVSRPPGSPLMWVPEGAGPAVIVATGVREELGPLEPLPPPPPPELSTRMTITTAAASRHSPTARRRQ